MNAYLNLEELEPRETCSATLTPEERGTIERILVDSTKKKPPNSAIVKIIANSVVIMTRAEYNPGCKLIPIKDRLKLCHARHTLIDAIFSEHNQPEASSNDKQSETVFDRCIHGICDSHLLARIGA